MNLSAHLKNTRGPLAQYMRSTFPGRRRLLTPARADIKQHTTILPAGDMRGTEGARNGWATIGSAIDYRLRYYLPSDGERKLIAKSFSEHDPYGHFFEDLDRLVGTTRPWENRLSDEEEDELNRFCLVLGILDPVRRGFVRLEDTLLADEPHTTAALLERLPDHWVDDMRRLARAAQPLFEGLAKKRGIYLNPTFEGSWAVGGADADLIVDGCLIDIKSRSKPDLPQNDLFQLLAYTLLDFSDEFGIDSVGIYMARQGCLVQWHLHDVEAATLDGKWVNELRHEMKHLLIEEVGRSRPREYSHDGFLEYHAGLKSVAEYEGECCESYWQ